MLTENQRKITELLQNNNNERTSNQYLKQITGLTDRGLKQSMKPLLREGLVIREKTKGKHPTYRNGIFNHVLDDYFKCQHIFVKYQKKTMSENLLLSLINVVAKEKFLSPRFKKLTGKESTQLDLMAFKKLIEVFELCGCSFKANKIKVTRSSIFLGIPKAIEVESDKHTETLFMMRDGISRAEAHKKRLEMRKKARIEVDKKFKKLKEEINTSKTN